MGFVTFEKICESINHSSKTKNKREKLFDESTSAITIISAKDNELLYINEKAQRTLMPNLPFKKGIKCYEYFHNASFPCAECNMMDKNKIGKTSEVYYEKRKMHAKVQIAETTWEGKDALIEYLTDITQEKKLEIEKNRVLNLNNRLNMIIDNLPEGITVYEYTEDDKLIPIRISKSYSKMMGKTYEESLEQIKENAFFDMHPDDSKLMKRALFKIDKSKEYVLNKVVRYYNSKLNRYKYIQVHCLGIPNYDGEFNFLISHIDIDEKYRNEIELKRAQKNLIVAIRHGGMEYIEFDIKNDVGYKLSEDLSSKIAIENFSDSIRYNKILHEKDIEKHEKAIKQLIDGQKNELRIECRRINQEGKYEWRRYYLTVNEFDENGKGARAVISSLPINELKRLEDSFSMALKQNNITSWFYLPKTGAISGVQNSVFGVINENVTNIDELYQDYKLIHPYDVYKVKRVYEEIDQGKQNVSCEARLMTSGGYKWIKISYTSVFDRDGTTLYSIGSSCDITEQKEKKYHYDEVIKLFENANEEMELAILADVTDSRIVLFNGKSSVIELPEVQDYKGYMDLLVEASNKQEDKAWYRSLNNRNLLKSYNKGDRLLKKEVELNTKNGVKWYRDRAKLIKNPENEHLMVLFTTLNTSKEQKLLRLIEKFATAEFDFVTVVNLQDDSYIIYGNKGKYFGDDNFFINAQNGIKGLTYEDTADSIDVVLNKEVLLKKLEEKEKIVEYYTVVKDEKKSRKRLNISYLDSKKTSICMYTADVSDIYFKEQKKNRELNTAKEEAEKANLVKTEFLGRMSHDMRTPLNAIIGLSDFGVDEAKDHGIIGYFTKIRSSSEFLLGLLNDLLDLTQIEKEKLQLNNIPVKISTHVEEILEMVKPRASDKNISVSFEYDSLGFNEYEIFDPIRTAQLFENIIDNAIKYTNQGGKVNWKVTDELLENGKIRHHHIISDNGIGMSKAFLSEMYKPFTRENRSLSEIEGGNGLGMSIIKILIETIGGKIDCQSKKNEGTTFNIEFDCDLSSEKEYLDNSKTVYRMDLNGKKLLLCEDVEINALIVRKLLDNLGVSIDVAENGLIGVGMVKNNYYDAILMDIRMPIMDGLEASREIRKFNKEVPIIALSANAYKEDVKKSYESGMNAHLSKPVMRNELIETIMSLCGG